MKSVPPLAIVSDSLGPSLAIQTSGYSTAPLPPSLAFSFTLSSLFPFLPPFSSICHTRACMHTHTHTPTHLNASIFHSSSTPLTHCLYTFGIPHTHTHNRYPEFYDLLTFSTAGQNMLPTAHYLTACSGPIFRPRPAEARHC